MPWLASFSKEELLAELLELLDDDWDLRQRFELRALSASADAAAVRRAVLELIVLPDDEYIEADLYCSDVDKATAAIDELIKAGKGSDAAHIAYDAIGWLTDSLEFVDESSGSVDDTVRELFAVHLRACQATRPEPAVPGTDLAELLLQDQYSYWPDLDEYADLLGDAGFAAVREHVAAAYAEAPASWRARNLMESMLRADGDVDGVVAIHAAHLDNQGRSHFLIARELDAAERDAEALGWAERGLREVTDPDHQLVEYLAGRYATAGRYDGDVDAAWAAAKDVAPEQQRLRLADASITSRPADALAVYLKAIEPLKTLTGDDTYRRMAGLLLSVRACHQALGTTAEFTRYLTVLRMGQKRKRNLMKILDQNGL